MITYIEQIKIAREKRLLTQEEVAFELGVSSVTVCRWEKGRCEPTKKAKKAIRDFHVKNNIYTNDIEVDSKND